MLIMNRCVSRCALFLVIRLFEKRTLVECLKTFESLIKLLYGSNSKNFS